jgi:aerobic-type carbon monoxide dehydrogenase small subunit (CoxS/CutS family)
VNKPAELASGATRLEVAFALNGTPCRILVEPAARLSDVLREELGLTGTKVGCNAGDCGACTVLIDDRPVCACLTAAAQVEGRAVRTVEGLARDGTLDRLQQAFLAHGAAQCGICTPGMLMAATDLLGRNACPDEKAVLDALGGVLCRCTGYRKIVEAVIAASRGEAVLERPTVRPSLPARNATVRTNGRPERSGSVRSAPRTRTRGSRSAISHRSSHATPAWST